MSISTNTTINTTTAAELNSRLIAASEDGDTELVQQLLDAGADPPPGGLWHWGVRPTTDTARSSNCS